jgi:hypothetical protein|tara:strand:+ start:1230 stop:1376 length:147 start_codon:yes stop_codon:yes gene_type:complete
MAVLPKAFLTSVKVICPLNPKIFAASCGVMLFAPKKLAEVQRSALRRD